MKRARVVVAALALAAPWLVAAPAGADGHIPEACAVPPFIDLTGYRIVIGTDASEHLKGTDGPDFICGLLGDDVIHAGGGDDLILGDTTTFFGNVRAPGGDDLVHAGGGDDQVLPGPGDDTVHGGPGSDFLALAVGDDVGHGGPGDDFIQGGFGTDQLLGQAGADALAGGFGDDLLNGGPGDDALFGELPPESPAPPGVPLPGPSTNDRCLGASGTDTAFECDRSTGVEVGA